MPAIFSISILYKLASNQLACDVSPELEVMHYVISMIHGSISLLKLKLKQTELAHDSISKD